MTKNYNDIVIENEALVKAMLGDADIHYKFGYLESFIANAMVEIPELKARVISYRVAYQATKLDGY